jgi:hypothetical protein
LWLKIQLHHWLKTNHPLITLIMFKLGDFSKSSTVQRLEYLFWWVKNSVSAQKLTLTGREICERKIPFHITLNQRHPFSITEFPIDFRNSVSYRELTPAYTIVWMSICWLTVCFIFICNNQSWMRYGLVTW